MVIAHKDIETIYKPSIELALKRFEKVITQAGIFTAGGLENIMAERRAEAERLIAAVEKKSKSIFPSSMSKQTNSFLLALHAAENMCDALQKYQLAKPELDDLESDNEEHLQALKENFVAAHQKTLEEHISLAKILLMEKDLHSQTKEMNITATRVNNLKRYITSPTNPSALAAVVQDTRYVENMQNVRRNRIVMGGLIRLIGYGVMVLSLSLGFAAAASLFFIGPVGLAGFGLSMGLNMSGHMMRQIGKSMMKRPVTQEKIISLGDSLKMFKNAKPTLKKEEDNEPILYESPKKRSPKH